MDILSIHYCDMQYMYMIQNFVSIIILYKYMHRARLLPQCLTKLSIQ